MDLDTLRVTLRDDATVETLKRLLEGLDVDDKGEDMLRAIIALSTCVTLGLAMLGWISPQAVSVVGIACFCFASGRIMMAS